MADMDLVFVVGTVAKLTDCGINTETERKSLDGTKAIVHLQNLNIAQFNLIRFDLDVQMITYQQCLDLTATAEWSDAIES